MNSNEQLHNLWQRDVPPSADMTFVLATLQRIERRRFWRGVLTMLFAGLIGVVALWLSAPALMKTLTPMFIELQSMTPVEIFIATLVLMVIVWSELRSFP